MKEEVSAGIIIFLKNGETKYLLISSKKGHWDFPKGHLLPNETNFQAALRETQEETGLTPEIIPGFNHYFSYYFKSKGTQLIYKTVHFFLGRSQTKDVILSFEHIDFRWVTCEEALALLRFPEQRFLLMKASDFIKGLDI